MTEVVRAEPPPGLTIGCVVPAPLRAFDEDIYDYAETLERKLAEMTAHRDAWRELFKAAQGYAEDLPSLPADKLKWENK